MKNFFRKLVAIISSLSIVVSASNLGSAQALPPFFATMNKWLLRPWQEIKFCKQQYHGLNYYRYDEIEQIVKLSSDQLNDYLREQIYLFESLSPGMFKFDCDALDDIDHHVLALELSILNKFFATYPNIRRYMIKEKIPLEIGSLEKQQEERTDGRIISTTGDFSFYEMGYTDFRISLNSAYFNDLKKAEMGLGAFLVDASSTIFHEIGHMIEYLYFRKNFARL